MLILSRRAGESVLIGEGISITVLRVKGSQVRLGIEAPKNLAVRREGNPARIEPDALPESSAVNADNEGFAS